MRGLFLLCKIAAAALHLRKIKRIDALSFGREKGPSNTYLSSRDKHSLRSNQRQSLSTSRDLQFWFKSQRFDSIGRIWLHLGKFVKLTICLLLTGLLQCERGTLRNFDRSWIWSATRDCRPMSRVRFGSCKFVWFLQSRELVLETLLEQTECQASSYLWSLYPVVFFA